MAAHAKLSPSASSRWFNCPGSLRYFAPPNGADSVHSAEGTFAHDIAAKVLEKGGALCDHLGTRVTVATDAGQTTFECDADMVRHLSSYVAAVQTRALSDGGKLWVEKRVRLTDVRDDVYGTADAVYRSFDFRTLWVDDLKYGAGVPVSAEDNTQLAIYGLGALLTLPDMDLVDTVVLSIHQPRNHAGGGSWTVSADWLRGEFADTLKARAEAASSPETAELCAGTHCRWCPGKEKCAELRGTSMAAAQALFSDADTLTPAKTPPDPEELTDDEMGALLRDAFPVIELWIKAVRDCAFKRGMEGSPPTGFKIVETTGNRRWIDEDDMMVVAKKHGVDPHTPKLKSPAQFDKDLTAKKVAKKKRAEILARLAYKPTTGKTLALLDDPRKAVLANPFAEQKTDRIEGA